MNVIPLLKSTSPNSFVFHIHNTKVSPAYARVWRDFVAPIPVRR